MHIGSSAVPDQYLKNIGYVDFRNDSRVGFSELSLQGHYDSSAYFMASSISTLRKNLSADGLFKIIRRQFQNITDTRRQASTDYTLPDTLMAALARFQFKCPSLLQFDKAARD